MTSTIQVLLRENVEVLRQGLVLVDRLDEDRFRNAVPSLGLSGPGPHYRHVIDFYRRLLDGLDAAPATEHPIASIDYDLRARDPRIEVDREACRAALLDVQDRLGRIERVDRPLRVRSDGAPFTPSTLSRELQALVSHTVHHYALIAVAARFGGIEPEMSFGVAPSTLAHWRGQCVS